MASFASARVNMSLVNRALISLAWALCEFVPDLSRPLWSIQAGEIAPVMISRTVCIGPRVIVVFVPLLDLNPFDHVNRYVYYSEIGQ